MTHLKLMFKRIDVISIFFLTAITFIHGISLLRTSRRNSMAHLKLMLKRIDVISIFFLTATTFIHGITLLGASRLFRTRLLKIVYMPKQRGV